NFLFPTLKPAANPSSSKTAHLELVAQYKLFGNIASMGVVRTISSGINGMDSLLLSFKDAKVSLLEWSLATNSIVTVSIHYYEREEFKTEFLANTCTTELKVDPSNRCAVLNFYGNKLAILPFRQEDTTNLSEDEITKIASNLPYLQSIVFDVSSIDSQIKIKNVIDMEFLYGCHEPTLAILFESFQTWPGKSNSIKDTCSVITVTLDISKQKYPVVFTRDTLPQTCLKLISVPDSMGVIIITSDAIIYIDDSSLGIGIAVNTYASSTTRFPLDKTYENLGLALEGSCHVILDNKDILLSLSNGNLYVIKLVENEETVTGIRIEEAGNSTFPSCACKFSKGYFILGSRLGDTHLIKYYSSKKDQEKQNTNGATNNNRQPINNSIGDVRKSATSFLEMSDYKFIVCDTLINVGPIVDMAFGELTYPEEESQLHIIQKNLEIVTCTGYNDESSICVFHRNVNPIVNNSFPMEDCTNIWTVSCRDSMFIGISMESSGSKIDSNNGINSDFFDKYLFISKKDKTMVLGCGEELQELQQTDFYTDGPTINIGCLLNGTRILQVYDHGLRFVDNEGKLTQLIPIDETFEKGLVVFASIVDPYVLLLFDNGDIALMKVDERTKNIGACSQPERINVIPTVSCCIYRDDSELFSLVKDATQKLSLLKSDHKNKTTTYFSPMNLDDDEFDELCKGFETQNLNESKENSMEIDEEVKLDETPQVMGEVNEENVSGKVEKVKEVTYWCTLFKQDGSLEIFKLPNFEEVFLFPHFDLSPAVLVDFASRQNLNSTSQKSEIKEILLINLGKRSKEPYLVARTIVGDIIIYKAYQYIPGSDVFDPFQKSQSQAELSERLAIRFSRVSQEYISRETIYSDIHDKPVSKRSTQQEPNKNDIDQFDDAIERQNFRLGPTSRKIIPFSNVGGYNGVFVTGVKPAWLLIANNNFLRLHPMSADGEIKCFTQFHNVHCKQGFLYANREDMLRLSELPSDFRYDMEWPIKKIPLNRTGYGIEYHAEMQVYALATSIPVEFILRDENGDPINDVEQERDQLLPETQKFSLELISPVTWETVDSYGFLEDEQILCIKCVNLQTKSTSSGRKSFIAVGTGFFRGEDVGMRGNVYIFEIIEVVPEPDNPQTNHKYKLLCHEEVKGSVTAICDVKGYLLTCVGPKIFIRAFEDNDRLISVAFIDIQIYGNSVVSVKDYILLGDVYKSVWFLGFQEEPAKLILVGKDYHSLEVSCLNYLIDEPMLYIAVADMDKNIHLFQYAPYNVQSFAGQKLIRRGDFHIGAQVKVMLSMPKKELVRTDPIEQGGTLDGSINIITPIPERMYKRLQLLHSKMVTGLQHIAGLNPKAFRLLNSKQKLAINPAKGILDGDLLFQFQNLAVHRQKEMTKHIGTTVERIIDDLLVVQESCDYF
ncbi:15184_t:CDS:10, partial [Funneliformis caledonium]